MTTREIVMDTETTGLDPFQGHRLVEIGCVELLNHVPTGKTFHKYLNPQRSMPKDAEAIHGLSGAFLADKPLFKDVVGAFLDFIGKDRLIIHNAAFDMKFLNAELEWQNRPTLPMEQAFDTLALARSKFPGSPANLDALCRRFGIDNSSRVKHGALLDSEILAEVYLELIGGRQGAMMLGGGENDAGRTMATEQAARRRTTPRPVLLTNAEADVHADFIRELGDNALWNKI